MKHITNVEFADVLKSYWRALYIDTSTASYILIVPFVLLFFQSLIKTHLFSQLNKYYSIFFIIIISLITSSELGLYEEWEVKLNFKAIAFLKHPSEVFETAKISVVFLVILFTLLQSISGVFIYIRIVHERIQFYRHSLLFSGIYLLIVPFILIFGLRGGFHPVSIHLSDVYFSRNNFINTATVNSIWNLAYSIDKNRKFATINPFTYYKMEEAKKVVEELHKVSKDSTENFLKSKKPNIVLLIMEGWAGEIIYSLDGFNGVTPCFEKLVDDGLLFTQHYASGVLSHEAISSILSAFPAQPETAIVEQPDKFEKLPCLTTRLQEAGYFTSFHFGGRIAYGNMKAYLYFNKFDNIIEGKDFNSEIIRGRLGVHDEFLFQKLINDINTYDQPFFATAFTLSSHSPYDQPMKPVLDWEGGQNDYINSVYYSDSCLNDFMKEAKKQPWYNNTLFIIVSDHSHRSPKEYKWLSPQVRQIPLLFYGEVLKDGYRGKKNNTVSAQVDIAATLLAQLQLQHNEFKWSKNLLNPYSSKFAYYAFDHGLGFIWQNMDYFVYDHGKDRFWFHWFKDNNKRDSIILKGKSYLQVLFDEYQSY